jgi:phage terminase small subunit
MAELNEQQARFCGEFLVDLNAAAAARRSGYSLAAAKEVGHRLLTLPHVRAEVDRLKAERAEGLRLKAEDVVRELAKLSHANMMNYVRKLEGGLATVDLEHVDHDLGAAIQEMTVEEFTDGRGDEARPCRRIKIKLADKTRALELLGRHLALFVEKHEVTVAADRDVAAILERRRIRAGLSPDPDEG